jgi:hypothetical protein
VEEFKVSAELVSVLYLLLPGFTAAWVFYGYTAHKKPSPFAITAVFSLRGAQSNRPAQTKTPEKNSGVFEHDGPSQIGDWELGADPVDELLHSFLVSFQVVDQVHHVHARSARNLIRPNLSLEIGFRAVVVPDEKDGFVGQSMRFVSRRREVGQEIVQGLRLSEQRSLDLDGPKLDQSDQLADSMLRVEI